MIETQFKALMHNGRYVDVSLLEKGIYNRVVPVIYDNNETIDSLIERGRIMKDKFGSCLIEESYFENLRQCELIPIVIAASKEIK